MGKRIWAVLTVVALSLAAVGVMGVNAQETTTRGWLGIGVNDVNGQVQVVNVVPGGPAEDAGLQQGDVITSVNGEAVDSAQALVDTISGMAPGDEVTLSVTSNGETRDVTVTLAERPANLDQQNQQGMVQQMFSIFGLNLSMTDQGLQVDSIDENSPFAATDLQEGDVITQINGQSVKDLSFMGNLMSTLGRGEPIEVTVLRDGQEQTLELNLDLGNLPAMPMQPGQQGQFMGQGPTQLGIRYRVLTAAVAQEEGVNVEQGALVVTVYDNTPASDAGLQEGDVITAVDGDAVDEEHTLSDRLYAYEEGDTVTLSVLRDGAEQQIQVTLGPRNYGFGFGMGPGMMAPYWQGQGNPDFFQMHPWMWMMPGPNGNGQWQWSYPEGGQQPETNPTVPETSA